MRRVDDKDKPNLILGINSIMGSLTRGPKLREAPRITIDFRTDGAPRAGEEPARVKGVKYRDSKNHHCAVEGNEIPLCCDEVPRPALEEFDGTIDAADVDTGDGEDHGAEEGHDGALEGREEVFADGATDEVSAAEDEDCDRGHLEDNSCHHDVRAWGGVAVFLGRCDGGHSAADGLDD